MNNKDLFDINCRFFCFDNLNKSLARDFILTLRKENLEFCLDFKDLSSEQAETIIKKAKLDQEIMKIGKFKNLIELYMKGTIPSLELAEYASKGIEYTIEINEKKFVPWRSIFMVASLGILQIVFGGVLMATGFGASIGMGMITEGISDMMTASIGYLRRQLDWKDYCNQKAISLVISAVNSGFGKAKDAAKGLSTLVTETSREALEQAGTQLASNTKVAAKEMVKTTKNLKSLTLKHISVKVGKTVAKQTMNSSISFLYNKSFDLLKPQIAESIQYRVKYIFSSADLNSLFRKMFALDMILKPKTHQNNVMRIRKFIEEICHESRFLRKEFYQIADVLLGAFSNLDSSLSIIQKIAGTVQGLDQLASIIDKYREQLLKKLACINQNTLTMTLILSKNLDGISKEEAREISAELKRLNIINEKDNLDIPDDDSYHKLKNKINTFSKKNEIVADFMNKFCDKYFKIELNDFSEIISTISNQITDQLVSIIESKLITPWSSCAVSSLTDSLSKSIQHHFIVDKNQNSDSHNEDQKKYDELKAKKDNNEPLSKEDMDFMKSYGEYRTIGEQYDYNAKDYCFAYTQFEAAYYATKESNYKNTSKEIKELAGNVRDIKPRDASDINVLANKNGVKLKIVNDKNYQNLEGKVLEARNWIHDRHHTNANSLLFSDGITVLNDNNSEGEKMNNAVCANNPYNLFHGPKSSLKALYPDYKANY